MRSTQIICSVSRVSCVANLPSLLVRNCRLPGLSDEAHQQIEVCQARLAVLPKPVSSEPISFVFGRVTSFVGDARSYVQGQTFATTLVQDTQKTYEEFRLAIRRTAPVYLLATPAEGDIPRAVMRPLVKLDDDEPVDEFVPSINADYFVTNVDTMRKRIAR